MINFKKMSLNDLNNIKNHLTTDFDNFWSFNNLKSELENPNSHFLIIEKDCTIIGFGGFRQILDNADIMNIVIRKDMRNKGNAKLLLNKIIELAKQYNISQLNLEVNENNTNAIKLYKDFNFKVINIRKKYYNNTDNAIIMLLNI